MKTLWKLSRLECKESFNGSRGGTWPARSMLSVSGL
jgi:hypothetical protein